MNTLIRFNCSFFALIAVWLVAFSIVGCASIVRESAARRAHVDAVLMGVE